MKTELKERDEDYELKENLPGFKKDQIDLQLQNSYLTITASKGHKDNTSAAAPRHPRSRCSALRIAVGKKPNGFRF